ncbi:hypothetical protein AGRI_07080 [Alishewanella agri BL06]|uniref:Ribosomal protein L7/L12 C-terminal domain-containing protein n=1 Tax=Alishewanella agri BL06 TaxID=1195246 RepID=I8U7G5_9ALTE|nr:hypothetical protein [Alishewanella agri]EIW89231.1 hypothetical protein AGRI_07080 [Alishewanella agri BL06]
MAVYLESFWTALMDGLAIYFDIFLVPVLTVVCFFLLLSQFLRYQKRIRYLEITLGALIKLSGIELNDPTFIPPEVRKALDEGHRLKAIRLYRKITGANLKEAIEVVDVLLKKT